MKEFICLVSEDQNYLSKRSYVAEDLDEVYEKISAEDKICLKILAIHDLAAQAFSSKELIEFFEALSNLLQAGLGIQESINLLSTLPGNRKMLFASKKIGQKLARGSSFYQALEETIPKLPQIIKGMIQVGEHIALLPSILLHLLSYLKLRQGLKDKLLSASMYPALVLCMTFLGLLALSLFFIPQLEAGLNTALSLELQAGIGRLKLILIAVMFFFFGLIGLGVLYFLGRKKDALLAYKLESVFFKIPFLGTLSKNLQFLSLCYGLEVLSKSAVQLCEALGLIAESFQILSLKKALENTAEDIKKGKNFSRSLEAQKMFPDYFLRWIQISEQSGHLEKAFEQLRAFYEKDLDKQMSRLMSLMEPLLIAFIGLILMLVVFMVLIPLFSSYTSLGA